MDYSRLFSRETVEIATLQGPVCVPAWRYQDMAVHDGVASLRGRWVITHLPTGLSFSSLGVFANIEDAWSVAVQIAPLRNDWTQLGKLDLLQIRNLCKPIFDGNNAEPHKYDAESVKVLADKAMTVRLNGYEAGSPSS